MKRLIWLPALAFAVMSAAPIARAAETASMSGTIAKVDDQGKNIEVTASDGTVHELVVADEADIRHNGQPATRTHLAVGQQVQVTEKRDLGKDTAVAITIEGDRAGAGQSSKVERTEIRSEAMNDDASLRPEARWNSEAEVVTTGADADVAARQTVRTETRIDDRGFREAGWSVNDLPEFRIVPTGSMRPGASITGPSAIDGTIRAALPLGREPQLGDVPVTEAHARHAESAA